MDRQDSTEDKGQGATEILPGAAAMEEKDRTEGAAPQDAGADAPAMPDSGDGTANGTSERKKRILIGAAVAVAVLALVGASAAVALSQGTPEPAGPAPAVQAEKADKKSTVSLVLDAEGAEDAPVKAKVKVTGKDGRDAIAERGVEAGVPVDIGKLAKGDYELTVTAAPVLEDGTTYTLPEKPSAIKVDGKGGAVEVKVVLEKVAAEDMDADALEAAADALAEAGDAGAAEAVAERAKDAPRAPSGGSGPAPGSGGSGSDGGGSSGGGGGSGPAPEKPAAPAHTHSYTVPVYGEKPWIVTQPAVAAVPEQGHWRGYYLVGGMRFDNEDAAWDYAFENELSVSTHKEWVVDVPAQPAVPEQGYYGDAPVVGHTCSCGARQ